MPPRVIEFTPRDWYWRVNGSTTRVYSSKIGNYVSVNDPVYIAWAANPRRATTNIRGEAELGGVLAPYGLRPSAANVLDGYKDGLSKIRARMVNNIGGVSVKDFGAAVDGVADDTAAVQAALDSGDGVICIPTGECRINQLSIPSGVTITGPGTLKAIGALADYSYFLKMESVENVTLSGLTIDVSAVTYPTVNTFLCYRSKNCVARDCRLINSGRYACYVVLSADCGMEDCEIQNYAQSAILTNQSQRTTFCGNHVTVSDTALGHQIWADNDVGARFEDNHLEFGARLVSASFGIAVIDSKGCSVSRNTVVNSSYEAIGIDAQNADCVENSVTHNFLVWPATGSAGYDYGMHLFDNNTAFSCLRNVVSGNVIVRSPKSAIACNGRAKWNHITNNEIIDPCNLGALNPTPGSAVGIEMNGGNSFNNYIADNRCISSDGLMLYGVKEFAGSDFNVLWNNLSVGHSTAAYLKSGANTSVYLPTLV
jgi:hypothetical protein